jgi:hypothetical protein
VDADFVNVFIAKQKSWIEDLLAKHIILESRLQIAEAAAAEKAREVENLKAIVEEKSLHINRLSDSNTKKAEEMSSLMAIREQAKQKKKKEEQSVSSDEF